MDGPADLMLESEHYDDMHPSDEEDDKIYGGAPLSLRAFDNVLRFKEKIEKKERRPDEFELYNKLYPPQRKVVDCLPTHSFKFKGFVVMAPMGFGKTFLMAFYINWGRYFGYNIVLVLAKATHLQIEATMQKLGIEMPQVIYHSARAQDQIKKVKGKGRCLFVVDEWNRLIGVSGNITQVGPYLAPEADHATIGLTANLIAKGLDDLVYMNMFTRRIPVKKEVFAQNFTNMNGSYNISKLADALRGFILVGVIENAASLPDILPEKKVSIDPNTAQLEELNSLMGFRSIDDMRACQLSVDKMKALNAVHKPAVVYCDTIKQLDKFITNEMIEHPNDYEWEPLFVHSDIKEDKFKAIIDNFNSHRTKQMVLFIGPSSKHGIEIYTGRSLVYWSPPTNLIDWMQIQGRLARPASLAWLQQSERQIEVQVFVIEPPDDSRMNYDVGCLEKFEILGPIMKQEVLLCNSLIDQVDSTHNSRKFLDEHFLIT